MQRGSGAIAWGAKWCSCRTDVCIGEQRPGCWIPHTWHDVRHGFLMDVSASALDHFKFSLLKLWSGAPGNPEGGLRSASLSPKCNPSCILYHQHLHLYDDPPIVTELLTLIASCRSVAVVGRPPSRNIIWLKTTPFSQSKFKNASCRPIPPQSMTCITP